VRIDCQGTRLRVALEERAPERSGALPFADKELKMKAAFASTLALAITSSIIPAAHADSSLASQVYRTAARDGGQLSHVFVLTHGSDVTLVGWVSDFAQVPLLGRSAMSVPGVTSVNNLVTRGH
jgi:osmotically-inducible protein OsmY